MNWIKASDKLPEPGVHVIIWIVGDEGSGDWDTDYIGFGGRWNWATPECVTHWMPIEAPANNN